jgi:glycosyltransferase involved in cell wall biosynthesis
VKILIHSNAPFVGTGYGTQTALLAPHLRDLGHEVFISAFHGLSGASSLWEGIPVLPAGYDPYGNDILNAHARAVQADLILTIMDAWVIDPAQLQGFKVACWAPVDCSPLSVMDRRFFQSSGAIPIAISKFGQRMFEDAGLSALYVPHGIDASIFRPPDSRARVRAELGLPEDAFVIAMNAANKDAVRKSFPEQFLAFSRFSQHHPEAMMLVHSIVQAPQALNLLDIVTHLGIKDKVRFSDQYGIITGRIQPGNLAAFYGAADVLSATAHAEGFGLPIIEAQACGTPVVTTRFSSMPELTGAGWTVEGEPFWNAAHQSWWCKPHVDEIANAYEEAYQEARSPEMRAKAREFALGYDANSVLTQYWIPALKDIEEA